jgi:transcriptional regulator with XRE-family HTH domain/mannose-6-phosphate isomerase-like protein (cupin superfamily)
VALEADKSTPERRDEVMLTPEIGERLRHAREARGLGVRALSRLIGVSGSTVSQIELGNVMPSVATLYRLVSTLQISMDDLFSVPAAVSTEEGGAVAGPPPEQQGKDPVQRREGRPSLKLASGVRWERLSNVANPNVEFIWSTYDPHGESCPADGLMRHGGTEFGYVQSGRLGVTIGFRTYELEPGDSISFNSTEPHRLFALGDDSAEVLWVIVGRYGDARELPPAPEA